MRVILAQLLFSQSPSPYLSALGQIQRPKQPIVNIAGTCQVNVSMVQLGAVVHLVHNRRTDQYVQDFAIRDWNMRVVQGSEPGNDVERVKPDDSHRGSGQ